MYLLQMSFGNKLIYLYYRTNKLFFLFEKMRSIVAVQILNLNENSCLKFYVQLFF